MDTAAFDNLATNGVINFDAEAYIRGTAPRYVGNPGNANGIPFEQPLMPGPYYPQLGAQLPHQPAHDEFKHEIHKKTGWKELLTMGIVGGLAVYAGVKFKSAIVNIFKKKTPVVKPPAAATPVLSPAKSKGIFKWFKNSKPAKITALVGVGLLGLYGLYDAIKKRAAQAPESHHPNPTLAPKH